MIKKIQFFLIIFLQLITPIIHADIVPIKKAEKLAVNFYSEKLSAFENSDSIKVKLEEIISFVENDTVLYYVFNFEKPGFILISADDCLFPVLAYSFEERYTENNASPEFSAWMDNYKNQIKSAIRQNPSPIKETSIIWEKYAGNSFKISPESSKAIAPLTYSKWGQGNYYNASCPTDPAGPGGHAYAGCVGIAISQVMYYYRYPEWGEGSHGYDSDYGYLFVDFENTQYHWNEMVDAIFQNENQAIADLIYHVGVAVEMNFSAAGSGSQTEYAVDALKNYFRYSDDLMYIKRIELGDAFKDSVFKYLDQKIPLIYRGGDIPSHSFVCDGYQDSSFLHFNWGWYGNLNGYYYIDNLQPAGIDFTFDQGAVVNILPKENYPSYCTGLDTLIANRGSFTDGSGINNYLNNSNCRWLISPEDSTISQIQLSFNYFDTEENKDLLTIYDGPTENDPVLAIISGSDVPVTITSQGNQLLFVFTSDNEQTGEGWYVDYLGYSESFCTSFKEYNYYELHWMNDGSGPYDYTNNSDCKWLIAPQSEQFDSIASIKLWFTQFDLMTDDTLFIYDGMYESTPLLGALSGNQIPDTMESSNNNILFNFKANGVNTAQGWVAHYTSNLPVYCNDTLIFTNNSGSFDDGSGNKNYMNDSECLWRIEPENAQSLSFSFSLFDIETGYDRLYIYDNAGDEPELLVTLTGHDIPSPLTLNTGKALIRFSTDESIIAEGWELTYDVVEPGITENNSIARFSIFPNPAEDRITISGLSKKQGNVWVEISSVSGVKVFEKSFYINQNSISFKLPDLPKGLWFVRVSGFQGSELLILK